MSRELKAHLATIGTIMVVASPVITFALWPMSILVCSAGVSLAALYVALYTWYMEQGVH